MDHKMNLPEPIGYYNPESGMLTSNTAMKGVLNIEWLNVYSEAQLREALAQQDELIEALLADISSLANINYRLYGIGETK